jgi:soluble lytic murein transglycosylase-like protein
MFQTISLLLGFTLLSSGIAISDLKDKPTKTESVSINISTVIKANIPQEKNNLDNILYYTSKKEQEIKDKEEQEKIQKKQEQEKIEEENRKQREVEELAAQKKAEEEKAKTLAAQKKARAASTSQTTPSGSGNFNDYIQKICNQYGCNSDQVIRVMNCESGGRANATNGIHTGLFQFNPNTFASYAKKVGISSPNIWDPYQQIQVAGWMFANGQAGQWSCK